MISPHHFHPTNGPLDSMQRKIKFFILSILAGALIFCGSVLLVESSTVSKDEMSMLYCFAPKNINLSSFVNECIK